MDDISEISQCASSSSRDDVGIECCLTNDESETNIVSNAAMKPNEKVDTENLEINDEKVHTESKPEASLEIEQESFVNEEVGIVYCPTNDESETNLVSNTAVRSNENDYTENLEVNEENLHTESKPEASLEIEQESFANEEVGLLCCSTNDESEINMVSNAAVRLNKDVDIENLELIYEKVLTESKLEDSLEIEQESFENEELSDTEPNNFEHQEETPSEDPDLFYYSLPKPQKYNSFKQAVAKELEICEKSPEKRAPTANLQQKKEGENIIDLGIFDESLLTDISIDTPAINPGSSRMKGQIPLSSAAYSPACPSRSMRTSSSFMAHMPVSNPEEFPKRSQVNCTDSSVTETPGAKHRMLKEDLMEKMKRSKEQKFRRQKEIETIDNEEECELLSTEEPDSSPDSDVENANSDCDPSVEDPIFSSFPSYQPGGGMKIEGATEASKSDAANDDVDEGSGYSFTSRTSFEEDKARKLLPETINNGTAECNTVIANEELLSAECEDDENGAWNNIFRTPKKFFHSYEDSVENICSGPFATPEEDTIERFVSGPLFEEDPMESLASRSPAADDLAESLGSRTCDEEVESYAKSVEEDSDKNSERSNAASDDETAAGMKRKLLRKRVKIHRVLSSSDEEMEVQPSLNDNTNGDLKRKKRCISEDSVDENEGDLVNYDDNNETKRRKTHMITDFIENEAELSGEEASSDENESGEDEPFEAEPEPEIDVSQKKLMEMHMKHLKDDDDKLEKLIKNDFLDEGEFFNEDQERSRKFRWIAQDAVPEVQTIELSDSEDEAKVNIDPDKLKWQKETEVIKQGNAIEADENMLDEPTGGKKYQLKILTKNNISVNETEVRTRRKVKRGSFMNKDSVKDVVNEETSKKIQCNNKNGEKEEPLKYG